MAARGVTMDALAEALADGLSIKDAARRIGTDAAYANAVFQRMRKRLGPQAR